jgi:hypothetical protein
MRSLEDKRVLLVIPKFFGYDQEIKSEIERRGAQVDMLPDRPFNAPMMAALTKFNTGLVLPFADNLYRKLLVQYGATHYDIIFVVNGQTLSSDMLGSLRVSFPNARFILYMWDSMDNRKGIIANLPFFDETFSFDPQSSKQFGMNLRSLFYSKVFECPVQEDFDFHLSFVGTAHSDRYSVVKHLSQGLDPMLSTYWYLFLQAPWVLSVNRILKPSMRKAKKDEFYFIPMKKEELRSIFMRSKAVLDIEHPNQRGMTMRTFETMGAQKKLVTTNVLIADYDFFDARNICILDRKNPKIQKDFLESPLVPLAPDIYKRYSIEGWLDEITKNCG